MFNDDTRGPRLQRVMADAGVGSRRHCEQLIEQGAVRVNGEVIDALPAWVDPARDRVEVSGRPVSEPERHIYVMLYKPRGTVSTNLDPEGRRRAIDLVQHPSGARLYPVGRLDIDSSGLLLLTNDGELANRLTHPRFEIPKTYELTVAGAVSDSDVMKMEHGIHLPGRGGGPGATAPRSTLQIVKRGRDRTLLLMQLGEGRNRQIRRTLMLMGHPVKKLRCVQMGALRLRELAIGEWRDLSAREVAELRKDAFRTPAERLERAARRTVPVRAPGSRDSKGAGRVGRAGTTGATGVRGPTGPTGATGMARAAGQRPQGRGGPFGPRGPELPRRDGPRGPESPRRDGPRAPESPRRGTGPTTRRGSRDPR